ncbi:uncharacterized protein LOC110234613, partial [Exaiptasia diaphana]|uniref:P2X purinoreceptor 7 intracellular domain-containing protein n=1 Tax=Exaiptasia diaphana TaxID=2652724 RepID=A0A913YDW4_EXADI
FDSSTSSSEFPSDYEIKDERTESEASESNHSDSETSECFDEGHHTEEPIADQQWLNEYEESEAQHAKLEKMLTDRLTGKIHVDEWCNYGKCSTALLVNISECYCCQELEGCNEAMHSDEVIQDLDKNNIPKCVTEHPGFSAVCLQKWSLRLAADKYKTRDRQKYKQTESEESVLRSIAYREFTRLIHGYLGYKKRIPLPACAYTCIRKTFKMPSKDHTYTGFEMDLESLV